MFISFELVVSDTRCVLADFKFNARINFGFSNIVLYYIALLVQYIIDENNTYIISYYTNPEYILG